MNYAYDLHSWSKHYREEALQQAQTRHLVERAQTSREVRGLRRVDLALSNAPTLLRGA